MDFLDEDLLHFQDDLPGMHLGHNTKCLRFSLKKHLSLMKKFIAFLTEQFRNRRPNLSLIKGIIMTE